jgi:hypothetical protein
MKRRGDLDQNHGESLWRRLQGRVYIRFYGWVTGLEAMS